MTFGLFLFPGAFDGRPADYLFMLLFNWICIVVSFRLSFWAGNNQFFFQITGLAMDMQACYLPWVILGFNYIIGGSYRWLPSRRGGVSGFGVPPASMRRAADQNGGGGRHNWGQGFRLGDQ
ncbi:hypothetical protein E2I00_013687 [Balaenoptera physalus]|uniref:Uncharacterized protein n=1 Tax=Balaenoptera physalus TaxID=9770 RepID=A0A643CE49_BALPH|nr:hypothetical protein E2I00_013687 [Balaenoptera physalus]